MSFDLTPLSIDLPPFSFEESLVTTQSLNASTLRQKAEPVTFPLISEVQQACDILRTQAYEQEAAGFAANQLGFRWAITMITVKDSPSLRNFRKDAHEFLEAILLNPSYEGIGEEKTKDWESCFSVPDSVGQVPRFTRIRYVYQDMTGQTIETQAQGFLARVLQHEIDHLNGILWTDRVDNQDDIITPEAYEALWAQAQEPTNS